MLDKVALARDMQLLELIGSILTAIGTVVVAVLAIWGDWFRARFAPAKLVIEPHNLQGDLTTFSNPPGITLPGSRRVYFYHLKVVNHRRWVNPRNCRVLLKAISKRGPDGEYHPLAMSVPLQFVWSPSEVTPPVITIEDEHVFDFGSISEVGTKFVPSLYSTSNNFLGFVEKNESIRYSLQIVSDGFISDGYQVFEVSWDGNWDGDKEKMQQHLRIKEIIKPELK